MSIELPEEFRIRMQEQLGDDYPAFLHSFDEPAVKAFRLNDQVISADTFEDFEASHTELQYEKIPEMQSSYYYDADVRVGRSAFHHAGIIYSQDPSAMLVTEGLQFPVKKRVLDLCAAPGGKSVQLAQKLAATGGLLVSNEPDKARNSVLCSNIERMGFKNVIVTCMYPAELATYYPAYFDLILVDAPCSGEGMFRKYPESVSEWSLENVERCAERQKEILESAAAMLKPGGTLVYSTCTYAVSEDEDIVDHISVHLGLVLNEAPDIVKKYCKEVPVNKGSAYRFYPHISKGEGQFMAYFKKPGELFEEVRDDENIFLQGIKKADRECLKMIEDAFDGMPEIDDSRIFRINDMLIYVPAGLSGNLPKGCVTKPGVKIGTIEKKRLVPHHDFFSAFGYNIKNRLEMSEYKEELYAYLHGEELRLSQFGENAYCGGTKGFGVVTFLGVPVGGFKLAGGRIKNHYPKGLRNL